MTDTQRTPNGRIFISYRRQDSAYPAGWLYDRLAERFGPEQVFKDVDSIELGDDFVDVITSAVGSCDVLLALIGKKWLRVTGPGRVRRLDDPNDFVRLEIEAALDRDVKVIPILVDGAIMPRSDELPPSISPLVRRHALELTPNRFRADTDHLLDVMERTLSDLQEEQAAEELPPPSPEAPAEVPPEDPPAAPVVVAPQEHTAVSAPTAVDDAVPATQQTARSTFAAGRRRWLVPAIGAAVAAVAAVAVAAFLLRPDGGGGGGDSNDKDGFSVSPKSAGRAEAVTLTSSEPCPKIPEKNKGPLIVYVTLVDPQQKDTSETEIFGRQFPANADGTWTAEVAVPAIATAGKARFGVSCMSLEPGFDLPGPYYDYPSESFTVTGSATAAPQLGGSGAPIVAAHRGGEEEYAWQTIPAFEHAARIGAQIETDVRWTKDGVAVLVHDPGTTPGMECEGGNYVVEDTTWPVLRDRCLSSAAASTNGEQYGIPTFTDAVSALAKISGAEIYAEVKVEQSVRQVRQFVGILKNVRMTDRAVVTSSKPEELAKIRAQAEEEGVSLRTMLFISGERVPAADLAGQQLWGIAVKVDIATKAYVKELNDAGLKVMIWIVNTPEQWKLADEVGADIVLTDRPVAYGAWAESN